MPRKTIASSNIGKEDRRHRSRDSAKVIKTPSVDISNGHNLVIMKYTCRNCHKSRTAFGVPVRRLVSGMQKISFDSA